MKPPIITVIGSLMFASGCLMVAYSVDQLNSQPVIFDRGLTLPFSNSWQICGGWERTGAVLTDCLYFKQLFLCLAMWWPLLLLVSACGYFILFLWQRPKIARVLAFVPLIAVLYSAWRMPRPLDSDLVFCQGRGSVLFICRIEERRSDKRFICSPLFLEFPSHRKLSGKTELILRTSVHGATGYGGDAHKEAVVAGVRDAGAGARARDGEAEARVRDGGAEAKGRDGRGEARVQDGMTEESGTIFPLNTGARDYAPGQFLKVLARVACLPENQSSWQSNLSLRLASKGVLSIAEANAFQVEHVSEEEKRYILSRLSGAEGGTSPLEGSVSAALSTWQDLCTIAGERIVALHRQTLGRAKGDLLCSIVLGDRAVAVPDQIKQTFRLVGLAHLLAASGFNLSIVVGSIYWLSRRLAAPMWATASLSAVSIISFVSLAGTSPSVVRAAIMCGLMLFFKLCFRKLHALAALSFALFLALAANPLVVSDVGLQLSYLATFGIVCGTKPMAVLLRSKKKRRLSGWFIDVLSVVVMAQLSVLPLTLLYFHGVGLMFLPANLLVDPVVAPLTIIGFISSVMAVVFAIPYVDLGVDLGVDLDLLWLPRMIDLLASPELDYMLFVASKLADLQGPLFSIGPPVPGAIAVYYACLAFFFRSLRSRKAVILGTTIMAAGMAILLLRPDRSEEIIVLSNRSAAAINGNSATLFTSESDFELERIISFAGAREQQGAITSGAALFDSYRMKEALVSASVKILSMNEFLLAVRIAQTDDRVKPLTNRQALTLVQKLRVRREATRAVGTDIRPLIIWTSGYRQRLHFDGIGRTDEHGTPIVVYTATAAFKQPIPIMRDRKTASSDCLSLSLSWLARLFHASGSDAHAYPFVVRERRNGICILN